jgi:hypothetical protein
MTNNSPRRVPDYETPDYTLENIPNHVIKEAIDIAVTFGSCPHCGERQFYTFAPGRTIERQCGDCNGALKVNGRPVIPK